MEIERGGSTITVTMELWENQNFWPIKGWHRPLGVSQFQVHFSEKSLQSNEFPTIPLPSEWKWSNEEWTIDKSRSYGTPDAEGWVYGPTFDRIAQNVLSTTASGVPSSICLCRKRRWNRTMVCSSSSILQGVLDRARDIKIERVRTQQFMVDNSKYVELLEPFERKRKVDDKAAFQSILQPFATIESRLNVELSTLQKMLQVVTAESDFACGKSLFLHV